MVTLAAASAYVGQLTGKQVAALAAKQASNRMWRMKTAREALAGVPRPRPLWRLTRWLKQPETLKDVILAPEQPGAEVVQQVDAVLSANKRWQGLAEAERLERAEKVTLAVYDAVLSAHSPGWSTRIGITRVMGALESQSGSLGGLGESFQVLRADLAVISNAGTRERMELRLTHLPSLLHDGIRRAWDDDPAATWALVRALTDDSIQPSVVFRQWSTSLPDFLRTTMPSVLLAAAELGLAYGQPTLARQLFLTAARAGAADRDGVVAQAALLHNSGDEAAALAMLEDAGVAASSAQGLPGAVHAVMSMDWDRARRVLEGWSPSSGQGIVHRLALTDRVIFLSPQQPSTVSAEMVESSIRAARAALLSQWLNGPALVLAQRLIARSRMGISERPYADLGEACDLAQRVRADRRVWRGDSAEPAAVACQAAVYAGDWRTAIRLGTTQGEATLEEAADHRVRQFVATAWAALGEPGNIPDLDGLPGAARARIQAMVADRSTQSSELHWRAALAASDDDTDRITALAGLARTGSTDIPDLDELQTTHPEAAAQIRATSDIARGEHHSAVERLRGLARTSPQAAALLAEAYERLGQVDDAVAVLQEAGRRFADPELAFLAVRALRRHDRRSEAAQAVQALLTAAPERWPGRPEVLQYAAQVALDGGDPLAAEDLLRSSLDVEPRNTVARWGLIRLLLARADPDGAYAVYDQHPGALEAEDRDQAHAWLELHRRAGVGTELAHGAVKLARQFADDEELVGHAVTALLAPGVGQAAERDDDALLSEVQALIQRYLDRWPDGRLRSVKFDSEDPQAMLEQIDRLIAVAPEVEQARRDLQARVARHQLPLGLLASTLGRSYAEVLVRRGTGILPAWSPDAQENVVSVQEASKSIGTSVVIDSSALTALLALDQDTRNQLINAFRVVQVLDSSVGDILAGRDALSARTTVTLVWNQDAGHSTFLQVPEEEADRVAEEAIALYELAASMQRLPLAAVGTDEERQRDADLGSWAQTIRMAAARNEAVWADDVALRVFARAAGVVAFSTAALAESLTQRASMGQEAQRQLLRHLAGHRVGTPMARMEFLGLAEDEGWQVAGAAYALGNPAYWVNPRLASDFLADVLPAVAAHAPDQLPQWLYLCASGLAFAHGGNAQPTRLAAAVLAAALHHSGVQAQAVPALVLAFRAGLTSAAVDPGAIEDPLAGAAKILLSTYRSTLPTPAADQYLLGLFSRLDDADRSTVIGLVLLQ